MKKKLKIEVFEDNDKTYVVFESKDADIKEGVNGFISSLCGEETAPTPITELEQENDDIDVIPEFPEEVTGKKEEIVEPEKPVKEVVGNLNNKTYHLATCKWAPKVSAKTVKFASEEEAIQAGYKKCNTCLGK
jgi:hypothetical protein